MNTGMYSVGGWTGTAEADVNLVETIKAAVLAADPRNHLRTDAVAGLQKATIEAAPGSVLTVNEGPAITVPSSGMIDIPFGAVFIRSIKFASSTESNVNIVYVY